MINPAMTQRMEEATRLTRAGRLKEAMSLLQGAMPDASHDETASTRAAGEAWKGQTFDGDWQVVGEESGPQREFTRDDTHAARAWRTYRDATASATQAEQAPTDVLPGTFTSGHFTHPAGTREYKLYIPDGGEGQTLPLVVMLHGCTQGPDDFAIGTAMNHLAEAQTCCVLYPAQPMSANHSRCWNWFRAEDQQREGGEPAILAGMIRQLIATHELDARRVYVAGLSAGGAMATTLAMTYPELFAAVGVHSGLPHGVARGLPDAMALMQGGTGGGSARARSWASAVPAIIFHGDRDTTVHPANADRIAAQYAITHQQTRVTVEQGQVKHGHAYTRTLHHDATGTPCLEQWQIQGAGHAWSGGSNKGSYTDPKGPDASREMLRFFSHHSRG
ncbi:PHB depolymerase family esterase [Larsenimonas sp. GH2-1]|uniref:PHB depolymerase family esterase n=2 Tax=Larsenimonas rhizosphaerae TaxID=2944682 RepID=A0AA42CWL4_9GAMM|nr:PHB depolymerase family esterase [Larsenimonas rhizosphaerae]